MNYSSNLLLVFSFLFLFLFNLKGQEQNIDFNIKKSLEASDREVRDYVTANNFFKKAKFIAEKSRTNLDPWAREIAKISYRLQNFTESYSIYSSIYDTKKSSFDTEDYVNYAQLVNIFEGVNNALLILEESDVKSWEVAALKKNFYWAKEAKQGVDKSDFIAVKEKIDLGLPRVNPSYFFYDDMLVYVEASEKPKNNYFYLKSTPLLGDVRNSVVFAKVKGDLYSIKDIFIRGDVVFFSKLKGSKKSAVLELYVATYDAKRKKIKGEKKLPFMEKGANYFSPFLAEDGRTLYFCSDKQGGIGGSDIYTSTKQRKGWSTPQNLGAIINTSEDELYPFVTKNNELYFSSRGHKTFGRFDIFYYNLDELTPEVTNISTQFNSPFDEVNFKLDNTLTKGVFITNRGLGYEKVLSFRFSDFGTTSDGKDVMDLIIEEGDELLSQRKEEEEIVKEIIVLDEKEDENLFTTKVYSDKISSISDAEKEQLNNLMLTAKNHPERNVVLKGFSPLKEECSKGFSISEKKVLELKNYLVQEYNFDASKIIAEYYGEYKYRILKDNLLDYNVIDVTVSERKDKKKVELYTINIKGENLWKVSKKLNLDVFDLIALNCDVIDVFLGSQIYVIVQDKYRIFSGDTWDSIARKYNITAEDILRANDLSIGDFPKAGSEIFIPISKSEGKNLKKYLLTN